MRQLRDSVARLYSHIDELSRAVLLIAVTQKSLADAVRGVVDRDAPPKQPPPGASA